LHWLRVWEGIEYKIASWFTRFYNYTDWLHVTLDRSLASLIVSLFVLPAWTVFTFHLSGCPWSAPEPSPRYLGPLTCVTVLPGRRTLCSAGTNHLHTPPVRLSMVGTRSNAL